MHICLVISSLGSGGAERVVTTLANEWVRTGQKVTIITLASKDTDFFRIDPGITRCQLNLTGDSASPVHALVANMERFRVLRKKLRALGADVIVSFMDSTNVLVMAATRGLGLPVVVCERSDPRAMPIRSSWALLRRVTYPMARLVVVQTRTVDEWAKRHLRLANTLVLPNPVGDAWIHLGSTTPRCQRRRRVAALGRLSHEKGFDVLIDAFARVSNAHPDWSLVIGGAGVLESELKRRALASCAAGRIEFAGLVSNPEQLLASAEVFVLPSRYEGFPNALVEAMACGCAVVATDCPSGPSEIVTAGRDGLLVPVDDSRALAEALDALMSDESRRSALGDAATGSARRFRTCDIAQLWLDALRQVARVRPRSLQEEGAPLCAAEP